MQKHTPASIVLGCNTAGLSLFVILQAFLLNSMFPRTLFFVLGVSWTFILFDPPRQTEHDAYLREMWANETWANLE